MLRLLLRLPAPIPSRTPPHATAHSLHTPSLASPASKAPAAPADPAPHPEAVAAATVAAEAVAAAKVAKDEGNAAFAKAEWVAAHDAYCRAIALDPTDASCVALLHNPRALARGP